MTGEIVEEISGVSSIAVSLQTDDGKVDEQSSEFLAHSIELEGILDQFELQGMAKESVEKSKLNNSLLGSVKNFVPPIFYPSTKKEWIDCLTKPESCRQQFYYVYTVEV